MNRESICGLIGAPEFKEVRCYRYTAQIRAMRDVEVYASSDAEAQAMLAAMMELETTEDWYLDGTSFRKKEIEVS